MVANGGKMTYPHVPAAFINAIAEEGTKAEAIEYLQKQWNETCALRAELTRNTVHEDKMTDNGVAEYEYWNGRRDAGKIAEPLLKAIEAYGFECEAGPLKNCTEWIELK